MNQQQLAAELAVWSKHKFPYEQCLEHAQAYYNGTLGEGLIKEFFLKTSPSICRTPTCTNVAEVYCEECLQLKGVVPGLMKSIGELLCGRV